MKGLELFMQTFDAPVDNRFIFTVKTDNAGTSNNDQFTIPTSTDGNSGFNYDIETSDGYTATGIIGDHTITFPSGAGTHTVYISGDFPYMYFNNGGDRLKMLDISNFGIYALGSELQIGAFYGCANMTITATDSGNFGSVNHFGSAWEGCSSLTSFPFIDTGNADNFQDAWNGCSSLTLFPLLDTSSVTRFTRTWSGCSSLTSFPLIDTSSGTLYFAAWRDCSSLTSFPLIDTSNAIALGQTWRDCSSLASFPSNAFDNNIASNYNNSFSATNLTQQSIDDILVSIDASGVSNGSFVQSGGSAPSTVGEAAIDNLRAKGWSVTVTGGY